jgi:transposase
VDDWAWRRGTRYGTILCDLEQHRPIDLLNERTADGLASWLREHPEVEVISRDRASCYAEGASAGAPQAVQVADRWHLLRNVREALMRLLDRHHHDLREAARAAKTQSQPTPPAVPLQTEEPATTSVPSSDARDRGLARYQRVLELDQQGLSGRAIARLMGLHRDTVQRYLHADTFLERANRQYARKTDSVRDFLQRRWQEGCYNAGQLTRELQATGMQISYCSVRRTVARWRVPGNPPIAAASTAAYQPSARRVSWLLLQEDQDLESEDRPLVEALLDRSPEIKTAADLGRQFREIIRQRQSDRLADWTDRAQQPGIPRELANFAQGLKADWAAVQAALTMHWNNGQVEGQVNRLKTIKRQMYGRAGFDLLRQRVLHGS